MSWAVILLLVWQAPILAEEDCNREAPEIVVDEVWSSGLSV
jgi:hypothetical protein